MAVSIVSMAGWVMAVCIRSRSTRFMACGSLLSTKMKLVSGLPKMGVITLSPSAKTSATTGSAAASSRPMLAYWLPWPGKRKATLPGLGPLPRKTPCACRAFQAAALSKPAALRALCRRSISSSCEPKSITRRSTAVRSAAAGGVLGGIQPDSTRRQVSSSRSFSATGDSAPMARTPRSGALPGGLRMGAVEAAAGVCTAAKVLLARASAPGTCSSSTT